MIYLYKCYVYIYVYTNFIQFREHKGWTHNAMDPMDEKNRKTWWSNLCLDDVIIQKVTCKRGEDF